MCPLGSVRCPGQGEDVVGADPRREVRQDRVRDQPASASDRRGSARSGSHRRPDRTGRPSRRPSRRSRAGPPRAASMSTWVSPSALARTSSADQSGFCAASLSRLAARSRFGISDGSLAISEMSAYGTAGGSSRTSVAGRIPLTGRRRRRHPAPAVADDLDLGHVQAGRPDPGRHVCGVVAEAMVTLPVPGQAMPRLIDRDDPPSRGGQRRPDPPPDPGRGRDAVDEHERPVGGIAPDDRGEGDPGSDRRRPCLVGGVSALERGGHGRRQVGHCCDDRGGRGRGHRVGRYHGVVASLSRPLG